MEDEKPLDDAPPKELVTITTAITPVIVKAVSANLPDLKIQRSSSETVLVIAQNPHLKQISNNQLATTSPVIVKNTNAIFLQNYNRSSGQSVIKSTKSEEWKMTYALPSLTINASKFDGDASNDSCSILTTASDNSMDTVVSQPGTSHSNEKCESLNDSTAKIFDENDDSRDSKTEDTLSTSSASQKEISRDARNKAEKQRRDRLNRSINELSTLVPLVTESARKIDKTGILRLTAHELRIEHVFGNSLSTAHRGFNSSFLHGFIDWLDGCLITTTCKGIIVVVSPNIEHYLGHFQFDLLGTNILSICHPDDIEVLKDNLMPHEVQLGSRGQLLPNTLTDEEFTKKEKKRVFHVRLARAVPRFESQSFELCRITGSLRRADKLNTAVNPPVRRQRQRNEETVSPSGNDVVFIGLIQVIKEQSLIQRLNEASKEEYKTRHLTDGRIVCCDQRISVVAGYMTTEVNGVSAFTFMHKDDVRWVIIALRQMYDSNKRYGESCYRLVTKSGEFIYMKTAGHLEVGSENDVQSFLCINKRLTESDGKKAISEMKHKFGVIVEGLDELMNNTNSDEAAIEDPVKLEQAIMHLITDLPSSLNLTGQESNKPTLSIITPQLSTVKLSIEKSFSVLGKTICDKIKASDSKCVLQSVTLSSLKSVDELPANDYIVDVIDKMDLFNEKKSDLESSSYFTVPSIKLTQHNVLNKSTDNSTMYPVFPRTDDKPEQTQNQLINIPREISENLQDITLPSTSTSLANDQAESLYSFDLIDPSFGMNSYIQTNSDNIHSVNNPSNDNIAIKSSVSSGDPLIGSTSSTHQRSANGLKRSLIDDDTSAGIKRRMQLHSNSSFVCDNMFPSFVENTNDHISNNQDVMSEGFAEFIDDLTDPNADLGNAVPRSLDALESSMTEVDHSVTQINPEYPVVPVFSDIIDVHSQNRIILENIQNEHKSNVDDIDENNVDKESVTLMERWKDSWSSASQEDSPVPTDS